MSAVTARIRIVLDIVLKLYDIADRKRSDGVYSFCVDTYNPEVVVERLKNTPSASAHAWKQRAAKHWEPGIADSISEGID
jgi:hypothetical protein